MSTIWQSVKPLASDWFAGPHVLVAVEPRLTHAQVRPPGN